MLPTKCSLIIWKQRPGYLIYQMSGYRPLILNSTKSWFREIHWNLKPTIFQICFFLFFVFFFHFLNNSFGSSNNNICTKHLNQFIESHKQFEQCALKHAVPVTMCEKCVEPYVSIVQIFHDLTTTPDPNNVRHKCIDQFIDHNALNIFWNQYQSSRNLWNEAACTSNSFV